MANDIGLNRSPTFEASTSSTSRHSFDQPINLSSGKHFEIFNCETRASRTLLLAEGLQNILRMPSYKEGRARTKGTCPGTAGAELCWAWSKINFHRSAFALVSSQVGSHSNGGYVFERTMRTVTVSWTLCPNIGIARNAAVNQAKEESEQPTLNLFAAVFVGRQSL